jgi:hypothetical protein
LELTDSKKSQELSEQILEILKTCGVRQEDLYKSANDTTNSSVKVGFLLTGEKGTCAMHTTAAIAHWARNWNFAKEQSAGQVHDSFVPLKDLFKELLDAAGWLNNKKSKGRYLRYSKLMVKLGRRARKLVVPNSTRVSGIVLLHLNSLLMERWNLLEFYHADAGAKEITDDQVWLASQVYVVLYPLMVLSQQVQTDTFGASSYTYFLIMRASFLHVLLQGPVLGG